MNRQFISIIRNLLVRLKRISKLLIAYLLYSLLYLRIVILRLRHLLFRKIKCFPKSLSEIKISRSVFVWNLEDALISIRIKLIAIGFMALFLIISFRLIIVASNGHAPASSISNINSVPRLNIVDRNNNLLAVNLPSASLYASPKRIIDPEEALSKLLTIIPNLDRVDILAKLKSDKNFVWIKRDITPEEHEKIYNLGIAGLGFEREQKRIYTYGNLLSHVIGYVGRDLEGLAGIEKYFDKFLTSQREKEDRSKWGNSLSLSIDVRVQNILSEEIEKMVNKFNAKGGAGIIVDANNGEIIALVSKPDFDPHHPGVASDVQLFNAVTQGVYELGSGMKSLTMAIGLDTDSTSMHDAFDLTYMKVQGFQLTDVSPAKGWQTVPFIFLKSSNIGIAQIMLEVGKDQFANYLRKLGMLDTAKIELPERGRPLFQPIDRWNNLSLTTMSYGYGISVSPLHFIQAMVPVMNGGTLYPLTLIKRNPDKKLIGTRVFKEKTSIEMRQLMRLVVSKGTGSKAEVDGYYVGGKTGTSNIANAGKYDKNRRISSFFGIIPSSNPRYIIYVVCNEPKGTKQTYGFAGGGWVGAPTVGDVFKRMAVLYGIEKPDENSTEVQNLNNVEYIIQNET